MSQTAERRPGGTGRRSQKAGQVASTVECRTTTDRTARATLTPLPWAQQLIENANAPIPQYGSPEWAALPDDSRVKVASTVVAAECWRTYWTPDEHRRRLLDELDAAREEDQREEWSPEVVASVHATANRLLQRPEPIDGRPRPGDYPGSNVLDLAASRRRKAAGHG